MNSLQIIGQRVRYYRKMRGLTQTELADKLGVAPRYIGNIEQGHRGPSLDMLVEICRWFGISTSDILPVGNPDNFGVNEKKIGDISDALRVLDDAQVEIVKAVVCALRDTRQVK